MSQGNSPSCYANPELLPHLKMNGVHHRLSIAVGLRYELLGGRAQCCELGNCILQGSTWTAFSPWGSSGSDCIGLSGLCWNLQLLVQGTPGVLPGFSLFLYSHIFSFRCFPQLLPGPSSPRNLPETCGFLLQAPLMPWTLCSKTACPIAQSFQAFLCFWMMNSLRAGLGSLTFVFLKTPEAELGFGVYSGCKENGFVLPNRLHGERAGPPTGHL